MMKSKPSRRKQHQRATRTNLLSLAVVVILIGISYLLINHYDAFVDDDEMPDEPAVEIEAEAIKPEPSSALDVSRIKERIVEETDENIAQEPSARREALQQAMRTPENAQGLQVLKIDVTGDGRKDWLVIHGYRPLSEEKAQQTGYEHLIKGAEVITLSTNGVYQSVLYIDAEGMRGRGEALLINQIPADYGYAFQTVPYDERPYKTSVMLFELAILDEDGNPASDDLTLYWKPRDAGFAATNAFGQPGTFDE